MALKERIDKRSRDEVAHPFAKKAQRVGHPPEKAKIKIGLMG
jgi:hypothetical protein